MSESDEVYDDPITDEVEELSDLAEAINTIESVKVKDEEPVACVPCAKGALECNFCDDLNEWPSGCLCKMCNGTGYRK